MYTDIQDEAFATGREQMLRHVLFLARVTYGDHM